jgi:hypothetical protein
VWKLSTLLGIGWISIIKAVTNFFVLELYLLPLGHVFWRDGVESTWELHCKLAINRVKVILTSTGLHIRLQEICVPTFQVFSARIVVNKLMCFWIWGFNDTSLLLFQMADDKACSPDYPWDQLQDWRNQNISLMALEDASIKKFQESEHEVDFTELLFRCAPLMKRMAIKLDPEVLPSSTGCKKICDIFKANPYVKY